MEEGRRRKAEASISGEGAGPQMGILAELRGPLPGGGSHTSQAGGAGSGNSLGDSQGREL